MADIEQGVKYTIEADSSKADAALAKTGENAAKAGAKAIAGFSPMKALSSTLTGNFAGLGAEVAKLVPSFRKMADGGAAALGAVSAAVFSVIKLLTATKDLLKTVFSASGADKTVNALVSSFSKLKGDAEDFARELDEAREKSASMSKEFEDTANAINKMTKAENEFARAQELALAKSEDERTEINRRYDRVNAANDASTASDIAMSRRSGIEDEIDRLENELEASRKRQRTYNANADAATALGGENRTGVVGELFNGIRGWFTGGKYGNDIAKSLFDKASENRSAAADEAERQEELEKKLEEARHKLKMADFEIETAKVEENVKAQMALNEDWADRDKAAAEATEAERKAAAEEEKRREEELADLRMKAEKEVHDLRLKDVAAETQALQEAQARQSEADRRVNAAHAAVQQAWGWYRDKDSMQAQLAEEKANAAAEKQFEKDFDKLTFRRDWRTAKNLSVDEEAVRRVGLAREEEANAKKEAAETAANTAKAVEELEKIRATLTEEA